MMGSRRDAPIASPAAAPCLALAGVLALLAAYKLLDPGGPGTDRIVDYTLDGLMVVGAVLCLLRAARFGAERAAWLFIGLALTGSSLGDLVYAVLYAPGDPPVPSLADPFWLSFLAFGGIGLVLLARVRFQSADKGRLIESGQAALIVAAFGMILLFYPAVEHSSGGDVKVAVTLAYPTGDIVLMSVILAAFTLSGFRPGRDWTVLGAGFLLFTLSDAARFLLSIGPGYSSDTLLEIGWPAAHLLIAYAAWMPPTSVKSVEKDDWRTAILPEAVSIISIAIQLGALFGALPGKYPAARTLIVVAQTLLLIKLADAPASYRRARSRDTLTGLGNRYALGHDLARCFRRRRASVLVMCEVAEPRVLAGSRGRARRDELLVTLGRALTLRLDGRATLYRGEEGDFLVLAPLAAWGAAEHVIEAALTSFEDCRDTRVSVRYGAVLIPDEGDDPTEALAIAERRLDSVVAA
jgi:GGDEF domain-containing protein